jgi:cyclopropane-fatty-acyl-phospholipid synthase
MTYSCAIFKDLDTDLKNGANTAEWSGSRGLKRLGASSKPDVSVDTNSNGVSHDTDELYEAQIRKLDHIIKKTKIQPRHRVLEIGSGWGSMAIRIASTIPDTRIDTLTLSVQQQELAEERIRAAGLEDRISVHLMDYRAMPAHWESAFDRFVSVEMIEAVGHEFLPTYWKQVDWALKAKDAVGVVQVITIPEARRFLIAV